MDTKINKNISANHRTPWAKAVIAAVAISTLLSACGGSQRDGSGTSANAPIQQEGDTLSGTIQLSGAFALYAMTVRWSEEFKRLHPNVRIDISGGGAGKGMTDALAGVVDLGMVSREVYAEELANGAFPIAVVKDAVIPTINAQNPVLADVNRVGLSQANAARVWNGEVKTWGDLLGTESKVPLHVFTRSDACGAGETFANWFGKRQEQLRATAVNGDPGVAAAIQKDRVGIGYNNIAYAYDQKTHRPFDGLAIIPLDVNGNGQVDPEEQFYETTESLIAAIKDDRYPSPPARDLYLVARGRPTSPVVIEFLRFVLTVGQQWAEETGYIGLSEEKLKANLEKLAN